MDPRDYQTIRQLFDDYLRMYCNRAMIGSPRISARIFRALPEAGIFWSKTREEWVAITRQDFAQIKNPIRIELKDLAIQSLADTIAVATGFFTIHLPIEDHILKRGRTSCVDFSFGIRWVEDIAQQYIHSLPSGS